MYVETHQILELDLTEDHRSKCYELEKKTKKESDFDIAVRNFTNLSIEMKKQKINQKELTSVSSGDIVNLHELLFTKNRDYLIKFNGDQVRVHDFIFIHTYIHIYIHIYTYIYIGN